MMDQIHPVLVTTKLIQQNFAHTARSFHSLHRVHDVLLLVRLRLLLVTAVVVLMVLGLVEFVMEKRSSEMPLKHTDTVLRESLTHKYAEMLAELWS